MTRRENLRNKRIPVFFNDHYCGPEIDFETFKKASKIADAIRGSSDLRKRLEIRDPEQQDGAIRNAILTLERFVDPAYLSALRDGRPLHAAASNGLGWDKKLFNLVVHSTTGILVALKIVQEGQLVSASLSSGLHHATPSRGAGYCTVNSLAIAALCAVEIGLKVVILDLDAHCGGGTETYLRNFSGLASHITHLDVSVSTFDKYTPADSRSSLEITNEDEYLNAVDRALSRMVAAEPDVVFYNAGVDIWPTVSPDVVQRRDRAVAEAVKATGSGCVVVMAGGYGDDEDIVPLHVGTLQAFAEVGRSDHESEHFCIRCGGKVIPIIYGYPGGNLLEREARGELRLGGCIVMRSQPTRICRSCGAEFGFDR